MKRNLFLISIVILIASACATQSKLNPSLYPTSIPNNVRYSPPSENDCLAAKQLLEKAFLSSGLEPVGLFKNVVAICPAMWSSFKNFEPFKSDEGAVIFSFTNGIKREGKAFKSLESLAALEIVLRKKVHDEGTIIIRPPNHEELRKYWAVIGWDLDSPLFVVSSGKSEYIFQFTDGHAANIVYLNSISFSSNP